MPFHLALHAIARDVSPVLPRHVRLTLRNPLPEPVNRFTNYTDKQIPLEKNDYDKIIRATRLTKILLVSQKINIGTIFLFFFFMTQIFFDALQYFVRLIKYPFGCPCTNLFVDSTTSFIGNIFQRYEKKFISILALNFQT